MKTNIELKKAIVNWLLENENTWQRVNSCHENFKNYIYDNNGNYTNGGEVVSRFIYAADKLIYSARVSNKNDVPCAVKQEPV